MVTTLNIAGMSCNACVRHVTEALRAVAGVAAVDVDLEGAKATVTGDVEAAALMAAVSAAGYDAQLSR